MVNIGGGGGKKYAVLVRFDGEAISATQGSITQITTSPYHNGNINMNIAIQSDSTFEFTDEDYPPVSISIYSYNGDNQRYEFAQANYNTDSLQNVSSLGTHTTSGTEVTTDLLTNFKAAILTLDLTYGNIGGSTGFSGVDGHCYIIFNFS